MSGAMLNADATLQCPHGGSVSIVATSQSVKADGGAAVTLSDVFLISGCPYQMPAAPSPIPSPCIKVQWVVPAVQVRVGGTPVLTESSVGLCLAATQVPQGTVSVVNTQRAASAR
ncbi:MAG: hypothetical protein RJQ04_02850 [Longimicrobiales bacterium]